MKILFVTGIFPPDRGGPASYIPRIAGALVARGHSAEVVCLSDSLDHDDSARGFRVHRIARRMFWPLRIVRTVLTIWRAALRHDIVYVNGLGSEAALAALLAGRPAVHKIVGDYAWERAVGKGWFRGTIDEYQIAPKTLALRCADFIRTWPRYFAREIIVPSRYLARIVRGWGVPEKKIRILYNAVEQPATPPRSCDVPVAGSSRGVLAATLITVCRLVPWKGIDPLIRVLADLPDVRLVIAGDGVLRAELTATAAACGVASRVTFLGDVPHHEVPQHLAQADIFILNSTYEGLPHVILEAMAVGLPVIATDAGGTGEVVEHEATGLLVPVGDLAALKNAIARLAGDRDLRARLTAEATRRMREHFDFETMVRETEAVLAGKNPVEEHPTSNIQHPTSNAADAPHENRSMLGVGCSVLDVPSILSLGYTRGLWDGDNAEDVQRMRSYAEHLGEYVIIANSYKRHRLAPIRLAPNFDAIPTNAFCFADSFFRMIRIGARVLRERRIGIVQAQDPCFTGVAAVVLGWRFGVPVNVCVYGPNVFDPHWLASHWSHPILARIGGWMLRRADGIQVDGKMTARSLIAAGLDPARVQVKPMVPANLDRFLAIERAPRETAPRVLFAGRLATQKNLPMLIDAARLLRERGRRFELQIVGDGPEETLLRAHAAKSGLNGELQFCAAVPREEIAEVFAKADVFALSSDYEGYPRVLMEAAASGLPIVTTAVSGSDEAVADGETGSIVPIGDTAAFAEKLDALLADAALRTRMGHAARQRMRTQLDPSTNTPAQLEIWRKVIEPAPIRNLLLFNLVTDTRDPILGFTTQWIRALAARVEHLDVLTMCAGKIDVPANVRVHSAGREHGWSEPRRALEFYRLLFQILRERRIDGCFSHMMPVFSTLAGPVLRARGIPLVTWYAHPNLTPTLKLAHFASHRMVTSLPRAYPYRRDKLAVIGQGIDTAHYAPDPHARPDDDLILCVSRLSRVKNHPTLLRAFARLPKNFRLEILGATAGPDDEKYAAEIRALAVELGIAGRVQFAPPVPPAELPAQYRRCTVHVNLTPAGFGDKVAWEAMSCGRPCLVANADFRETLGEQADALLFRENDAADLAEKLTALLAKSAAERDTLGLDLRAQVERLHSLPRLAERILAQLQTCRRATDG